MSLSTTKKEATKTILIGNKLPSKGEVMHQILYLHTTENKTIHESEMAVIQEVFPFWEKARVPTNQEYNAVNKLHRIFKAWQGLKKASKQAFMTQKDNEALFIASNQWRI